MTESPSNPLEERAVSGAGRSEFEALRREKDHLLDELEMAYQQMEKLLATTDRETQLAYDELRKRNDELQRRLTELEEAHGQLRDTQRQLLRAERMSAMGQLAAAIVHEIRNPLSVISIQVERLLRKADDEDQHRALEQTLQAVWRLDKLTENILGFSRKKHSEVRSLDLSATARDLVAFFAPLVPKEVEVRPDLVDGLPPLVGDVSTLEQVLINFLVNAIDAVHNQPEAWLAVRTGTESVSAARARHREAGRQMRLAVEVEEAILQEARVFIEVEDSGPGIAAEMLDWVFEPFFTTKGEEHGTGLGLAICRNIAVEYGGNILVSTEAGAGTSLVLFLPF